MVYVEDVAERLLGWVYAEELIESCLGRCQVSYWENTVAVHPRLPVHYFSVRSLGLQIVTRNSKRIETLFFSIVGDRFVDPYPWSCRNGIDARSTRDDVRRILGTPTKSGAADWPKPVTWDAYDRPGIGRMHFQYGPESGLDPPSLTLITVMIAEAVPGGETVGWTVV
jgi:hypothetical protein